MGEGGGGNREDEGRGRESERGEGEGGRGVGREEDWDRDRDGKGQQGRLVRGTPNPDLLQGFRGRPSIGQAAEGRATSLLSLSTAPWKTGLLLKVTVSSCVTGYTKRKPQCRTNLDLSSLFSVGLTIWGLGWQEAFASQPQPSRRMLVVP